MSFFVKLIRRKGAKDLKDHKKVSLYICLLLVYSQTRPFKEYFVAQEGIDICKSMRALGLQAFLDQYEFRISHFSHAEKTVVKPLYIY